DQVSQLGASSLALLSTLSSDLVSLGEEVIHEVLFKSHSTSNSSLFSSESLLLVLCKTKSWKAKSLSLFTIL
ncbi:MAG: hypothetical protein KDH96_13195, partial [Candidatus Riesia sp.]|nr:hypothetical protein [Candidatus Riesia sp.]